VEEGLSFLAAKGGVVKTFLSISEGRSLRTQEPLLGVFPVPQKRAVLYLIPEMTERRFRNRCELLGVDIHDSDFRVRTMSDGAPLPLNDPLLRQCAERLQPIVYLDTAACRRNHRTSSSLSSKSWREAAKIPSISWT